MPKQRGSLVAISPDLHKVISSVGYLKNKFVIKDNNIFIVCSKVKESSMNYMDLVLVDPTAAKDSTPYVLSVPHRSVLFVLTAEEAEIKQSLGFHSNP